MRNSKIVEIRGKKCLETSLTDLRGLFRIRMRKRDFSRMTPSFLELQTSVILSYYEKNL